MKAANVIVLCGCVAIAALGASVAADAPGQVRTTSKAGIAGAKATAATKATTGTKAIAGTTATTGTTGRVAPGSREWLLRARSIAATDPAAIRSTTPRGVAAGALTTRSTPLPASRSRVAPTSTNRR